MLRRHLRQSARPRPASPIRPSASAALPLHERRRVGQRGDQRIARARVADEAERERRHLPHFGIGVGEQRHERRHAVGQTDATDGQRGAAADARLGVAEQRVRSGGGGGGGGDDGRRRAARAAGRRRQAAARRRGSRKRALILEPEDPRHLLFERTAPARLARRHDGRRAARTPTRAQPPAPISGAIARTRHVRDDIIGPPCTSATSRSKDRSARARPRSPNGSARDSTPRSCSRNTRIRSSPTSTPTGRAPRSRRSSSICSTAIASRRSLRQADLFSQIDDLRLPVRQGQDLRVSEPRRQRAVHLSAALRSARARRAAARSRHLPAGADRRAAAAAARPRRAIPRRAALRARPGLPAGAERGLPPLLLPLQRHAAARRRDLAVRLARRATRRSTIWSGRSRTMGARHAVLRAATDASASTAS